MSQTMALASQKESEGDAEELRMRRLQNMLVTLFRAEIRAVRGKAGVRSLCVAIVLRCRQVGNLCSCVARCRAAHGHDG